MSATEAPNDANEPDTLLPLITEATQGEYTIDGELGRGGMAVVYRAHDVSLNRKVAIKTMLPELTMRASMVQRFKREAQMAAGLSHPHIIQIFAVKDTKRLVFFVMKFIEGRSLDSLITEKGALDLEVARLVLQQAGSALSFAHHRGVVHRDIKPANIMIDENGWAVVTDFGIAKLDDGQALTATGTTMGTPHYMAPEQFHNKPATGASDQYALGIVAYEMLTGKKPFDGGTFAEIITKQLFSPPPDILEDRPDLPAGVSDAIKRMLAKEPEQRFPDLDAAIKAFGPPASEMLDATRARMVSMARSLDAKAPRLSVPMSPVPITHSSEATRVMSADQPRVASLDPTIAVAPLPGTAAPSSAAVARRGRSRGWIWATAAVVVLAVPGYFAAQRWMPGRLPAIPGMPSSAGALDRGVRLWQQGQPAAAQAEFARAAREQPKSSMPHIYLSRIARETGNLDVARAEAATALRLEPQNALALREMAAVLLAAGNYELARRFFIRALQGNNGDRAAMGGLACSLERLGRDEEAARWRARAGGGAACAQ